MPIDAILPEMVGDNSWGKSLDGQDEILERSSAVTGTLRNLIPWAGYTLSVWDVGPGTHSHLSLANEGYSQNAVEHLNNEYVATDPSFLFRPPPVASRYPVG